MTTAELNDPRGPIELLITGCVAIPLVAWFIIFLVAALIYLLRSPGQPVSAELIEEDENEPVQAIQA